MVNARAKGSAGEREFCKWLQETLNLDRTLERNLNQVRNGGADIEDVYPFLFEIKRCEQLKLRDWWFQVKTAAKDSPGSIPIVAYRQNRKKWKFLISAQYIGLERGFIQLEEIEFKQWLKNFYQFDERYR